MYEPDDVEEAINSIPLENLPNSNLEIDMKRIIKITRNFDSSFDIETQIPTYDEAETLVSDFLMALRQAAYEGMEE